MTKHIKAMRKRMKRGPGAGSARARRWAKYMVLTYCLIMIIAVTMMLLGIGVPGQAWEDPSENPSGMAME